jgi:hypothetical protein
MPFQALLQQNRFSTIVISIEVTFMVSTSWQQLI